MHDRNNEADVFFRKAIVVEISGQYENFHDEASEGECEWVHYNIEIIHYNIKSQSRGRDAKQEGSVLYISFGSLANLNTEQAQELVYALQTSSFFHMVGRPRARAKQVTLLELGVGRTRCWRSNGSNALMRRSVCTCVIPRLLPDSINSNKNSKINLGCNL